MRITQSVGEEKTSRVVEVMLATLRPTQLLFNGANSFYHVLAFIPWTAPVVMPTMFAIGAAPAWQVIASAVLCVIATLATARISGIVYRRSVMRTGARVKLRQVLRANSG